MERGKGIEPSAVLRVSARILIKREYLPAFSSHALFSVRAPIRGTLLVEFFNFWAASKDF